MKTLQEGSFRHSTLAGNVHCVFLNKRMMTYWMMTRNRSHTTYSFIETLKLVFKNECSREKRPKEEIRKRSRALLRKSEKQNSQSCESNWLVHSYWALIKAWIEKLRSRGERRDGNARRKER